MKYKKKNIKNPLNKNLKLLNLLEKVAYKVHHS